MLFHALLFLLLGYTCGVCSRLIGIGGGTLITPALIYLFGFEQHLAQGTTLALLVPPIGLMGALTYYRQGYAEALASIGFEVTAFDISPTAIAWCQQRFPDSKVDYVVADLLAIPSEWHNAFDLVFESRNIQSLPLSIRSTVPTVSCLYCYPR